ncbi:hypothetical protein [Robertmurraya massiliosenegalensis]|uniref:hypothetical protein n=1 Tax=Robertmurraya massiliosenegalensis TaxID=1287657 RepID=UPI0002FA3CC5|nr:hypothetical protein [Robertmurraya massiliosenegalensis]
MENHALSELKLLNQMILGIFIAGNVAFYLSLTTHSFPGLSYLGIGVGITVILSCWLGKRCFLFIFGLMATTAIFTLAYEWATIFH